MGSQHMRGQEAVYHSPGVCSSIALFTLMDERTESAYRSVRERVAHLMHLLAETDGGDLAHRPENLHLLVAVSKRVLGEAPNADAFEEFPINFHDRMQRGNGQADVLVQVSGPNEGDRRYGLRLATEIIRRGYGLKQAVRPRMAQKEVHGGKIFSGLEPFGYRDSARTTAEGFPGRLVAEIEKLREAGEETWIPGLQKKGVLPEELDNPEGVLKILRRVANENTALPSSRAVARDRLDAQRKAIDDVLGLNARGPSWLLYMRFEHDFENMTDDLDEIIGKKRLEVTPKDPKEGTHLDVAKKSARQLVRRGFSYRTDEGIEGLAFVALASTPTAFKTALERHAESDRLLSVTYAVDAGVYVVPSDSGALDVQPVRTGAESVPAVAKQLLRPRNSPIPPLVDYPVSPQLLSYIELARAQGMFLEPTMKLRPDIEVLLRNLEDALGGIAIGNELRVLREQIRQHSEAVYLHNGGYFTLGA